MKNVAYFLILLCLIVLSGCATTGKTLYAPASKTEEQIAMDQKDCRAVSSQNIRQEMQAYWDCFFAKGYSFYPERVKNQ